MIDVEAVVVACFRIPTHSFLDGLGKPVMGLARIADLRAGKGIRNHPNEW
jgi:hypothetical protein